MSKNNLFAKFCKKYIFKNRGTTRLVFTFPRLGIVLKIPNFTYSMSQFLLGMYCNYYERKLTKQFKNCYDKKCRDFYDRIAPTYFASWFGLFSIQKYVCVLSSNDITDEDKDYFIHVTNDFYYRNFGYEFDRKTQEPIKLVCLDYGQPR